MTDAIDVLCNQNISDMREDILSCVEKQIANPYQGGQVTESNHFLPTQIQRQEDQESSMIVIRKQKEKQDKYNINENRNHHMFTQSIVDQEYPSLSKNEPEIDIKIKQQDLEDGKEKVQSPSMEIRHTEFISSESKESFHHKEKERFVTNNVQQTGDEENEKKEEEEEQKLNMKENQIELFFSNEIDRQGPQMDNDKDENKIEMCLVHKDEKRKRENEKKAFSPIYCQEYNFTSGYNPDSDPQISQLQADFLESIVSDIDHPSSYPVLSSPSSYHAKRLTPEKHELTLDQESKVNCENKVVELLSSSSSNLNLEDYAGLVNSTLSPITLSSSKSSFLITSASESNKDDQTMVSANKHNEMHVKSTITTPPPISFDKTRDTPHVINKEERVHDAKTQHQHQLKSNDQIEITGNKEFRSTRLDTNQTIETKKTCKNPYDYKSDLEDIRRENEYLQQKLKEYLKREKEFEIYKQDHEAKLNRLNQQQEIHKKKQDAL